MGLGEVFLKGLTTITDFCAGGAGEVGDVASPGFEVEMLGVFVPLPVVFAAEGLGAGGEGTAVGPLVALHVFSVTINITSQCRRGVRTSTRKDVL